MKKKSRWKNKANNGSSMSSIGDNIWEASNQLKFHFSIRKITYEIIDAFQYYNDKKDRKVHK